MWCMVKQLCTTPDCGHPIYALGLCRNHYRKSSGEARKRWEALKADTERHDKHKQYMREWFREYPRDYRKHADAVYFDHNRSKVLERDGYRCVECGMAREEHQEKYGKDLNVHHVDGFGFSVKKPQRNSSVDNLKTLCVSCHAKAH